MKPKNSVDRRKFLKLSGMATALITGLPNLAMSSAKEIEPTVNSTAPTQPILPIDNNNATIIESKVICRQPGKYLGDGSEYDVDVHMHPVIKKRKIEADRYMGWPTITQTKSGELLAVVSGDRDAHVCPWGKTQMIRSQDQGKTWSKPEVINNTPLDDRDAGIIETKKGTLLVSWFTSVAFTMPVYATAFERYARLAEKVTPEVRKQWLGNWTRRSEDGGKTWKEPVRTTNSAPHGPICLKDNTLLYVGTVHINDLPTMMVERSTDDGKSWKTITHIPLPVDDTVVGRLSEPHMVELKSGKLIAMFRNEPKDRTKCFLLQSESYDKGKTWTPMHSTGIWGYPPHLIQLKNGWVLVVYGYRLAPISERACMSKDEGKTWDIANTITISNALGADMGYPSSVQLSDESILTVYYQAEVKGGPTVLQSTHWKLV
jgi:sialidase-1